MHVPSRSAMYWHLKHFLHLPRQVLIKLVIGLGLAVVSMLFCGELIDDILEAETGYVDAQAFALLHAWDPVWMPDLMYYITKSGSAPTAVILSLGVAAWLWFKRRNFHALAMFGIASLGGLVLNRVLKMVLQRPRPVVDPNFDAIGWSLPSGHAMAAAIFYGFITYLVIRSRRKVWTKVLVGIPLMSFVLLIGLSRVYLQAHYFSDVVAGYAAGCAWLMTCILALEFKPWYRKHFTEPEGHLPGDNSLPPEEARQPVA